jgi:hypothetical protein
MSGREDKGIHELQSYRRSLNPKAGRQHGDGDIVGVFPLLEDVN